MSSETKEKGKPGIAARTSRSLRDMRGEMKKVVWPTRSQTANNTAIVLAFMAVMAVIIGLIDTGLSALVKLMVGA